MFNIYILSARSTSCSSTCECTLPSQQGYRKKRVPRWNCSQRPLSVMIFEKRHCCRVFPHILSSSGSIMLEGKQTFLQLMSPRLSSSKTRTIFIYAIVFNIIHRTCCYFPPHLSESAVMSTKISFCIQLDCAEVEAGISRAQRIWPDREENDSFSSTGWTDPFNFLTPLSQDLILQPQHLLSMKLSGDWGSSVCCSACLRQMIGPFNISQWCLKLARTLYSLSSSSNLKTHQNIFSF